MEMEKDPSAPADPVQPYPPVQQEQPYPSQQPYPQLQPYPPYPAVLPPYPQQPYPPAGYPPQELAMMGEAPPPYTAQQTSNAVVVQSQPQPVVRTVCPPARTGDYNLNTLIFAIVTTGVMFFCFCWWGLLCAGIGIGLAIGAWLSASNGDLSTARSYNTYSLRCTICGIVSVFVGIVMYIALVVVSSSTS